MKKATIVGLSLLIALLLSSAPESVATPAWQIVTRPAYEIMLSAAPPSGTVVYLEIPGEYARSVPMVDVPGMEHRIGGQR